MHVSLLQGLVISLAGGLGGADCALFIIYVPKAPSIIISILKLLAKKEREVVEKERERHFHIVVSEIAVF